MQYVMQVFEYEDNEQFRVIDRHCESWFILNEVCKRLGIVNAPDAASRLDDDEKMPIGNPDSHSGRGGARLQLVGHIMADKSPRGIENRPDVSVGRLFAEWLKTEDSTLAANYKAYLHVTPEWEGEARQYPISLLPHFIKFVDTVWIPEHSERYFNECDPAALPYLPRLITSGNYGQISAA